MRFVNRIPVSILRPSVLLLAVGVTLAACDDDDETSTGPTTPDETSEVTVDASTAPGHVRLDPEPTVVSVTDPSTSTAWDLSFLATGVSVNGGAAGPGGVTAFCICQNENATDAQVMAMTPQSELAAFEAVDAGDIPGDASFVADELQPAISDWFTGTPGPSATADATRSWIIRKGTTSPVLAKFRVTSISGATAESAGSVTFEYAIQPSEGAEFGATQTGTVTIGTTPVYFDLAAGAESDATAWDVRFSGWDIQLNGGASGTGGVSAVVDESTPFAQITSTYAAMVPPQAFRSDAFGGVFTESPWYRYNITGTDNQIWPTFNVYLIKRGAEVHKVQLTSYYSTSGQPRHITLRSARLR